ncbi:MAG: hypothetical protein JWP91_3352 [Fibrobacteres bacterium]|nr:hypothetical protein [Fibrobacterota bacterium]
MDQHFAWGLAADRLPVSVEPSAEPEEGNAVADAEGLAAAPGGPETATLAKEQNTRLVQKPEMGRGMGDKLENSHPWGWRMRCVRADQRAAVAAAAGLARLFQRIR